jgi:hypothetical protein
MALTLNGDGDITGLAVGGLPSGVVTSTNLSASIVPIGVNQAWANVTTSRALSTTYTNTTGKPIQLYIVCTGGNSNGAAVTIGGVTPAFVYTNVAGGRVALFVIIPNEVSYSLGDASSTIHSWWELR